MTNPWDAAKHPRDPFGKFVSVDYAFGGQTQLFEETDPEPDPAYIDLLDRRDALRHAARQAEDTLTKRELTFERYEVENNIEHIQREYLGKVIAQVDDPSIPLDFDGVDCVASQDDDLDLIGDVALRTRDIPTVIGLGYSADKTKLKKVLSGVEAEDTPLDSFALEKNEAWSNALVQRFAEEHPGMTMFRPYEGMRAIDDRNDKISATRLVDTTGDGKIDAMFQAKVTSRADDWYDGVPDDERARILWNLERTGLDKAYVSVVIDDYDIRDYVIRRGEPINDTLGTISDNQHKIDKFRDEVIKTREKGWTYRGANVKPEAKHELENELSMIQGRAVSKVKSGIAKRMSAGATYSEALTAELRAHPPNLDNVVVLDLETTGTSPANSEVIEIGWQKLDSRGNVKETGEFLFSPDRRFMDRKGTGAEHVHGISPDMVAGKPSFHDVAPQLMRKIGKNATIVAHHASFEKSYLDTEMPDNNFTYLDTEKLSKHFIQTENNKLSSFTEANGVAYEGAHRSMADVDMTRRALLNFLKG